MPEPSLAVEGAAATSRTNQPTATDASPDTPNPSKDDVGSERVGETVTVSGTIQDAASFSAGFRFVLEHGTAQTTLLTWLETYDAIAGREELRPGAQVRVTGKIDQFEGQLQIVPTDASDVIILTPGRVPVPERTIGTLTTADMGEWVSVTGQIVRFETFSSGTRVYLNDGSGEILALLWQNVLERVPDPELNELLAPGEWMHVIGKIEEYQGTLEIVPALPFDLQIFETVKATETTESVDGPTVVATPTPLPVIGSISDVTREVVGRSATLTGQVIDTASFSRGFKFTLDDGTGQILLLTWHDVYDECPDAADLNLGASVSVTGKISEYEGQLQIEPGRATDMQVISAGVPFLAPQATNAIGAHFGQRVTISGRVTRSDETNSGLRLYVADDTGEALVFIWNNILERVRNPAGLVTPGAQVRIAGMVQEYRGEIEIVPALPYDLEVLQ
jgi:DNA/RNA endonuclease YhcR with UshA esterase domain